MAENVEEVHVIMEQLEERESELQTECERLEEQAEDGEQMIQVIQMGEQLYAPSQTNLQRGDRFWSLEELQTAIDNYQILTGVKLWIRDSKRIEQTRKKPADMMLVYKFILYSCIHGGRKFKSKSTGQRSQKQTFRTDCGMHIRINLGRDGQHLVISDMEATHNHEIIPSHTDPDNPDDPGVHRPKGARRKFATPSAIKREQVQHVNVETSEIAYTEPSVVLREMAGFDDDQYDQGGDIEAAVPQEIVLGGQVKMVRLGDHIYTQTTSNLGIGDQFKSLEELQAAIELYQVQTGAKLWIRDSKRIKAKSCEKKNPADMKLVYQSIIYYCIYGGRKFKSKGTGQREHQSFRNDCNMRIKVSLSRNGQCLEIADMDESHNHDTMPLHTNSEDSEQPKPKRMRHKYATPTAIKKDAHHRDLRVHTPYREPRMRVAYLSTREHGGVLQSMAKGLIPPLTHDKHKGQAGRIGIIGGCQEYTGAPYFAAISAMKVGADLSHVFCMKDASPVIKSYSPELIVHPVLDHEDACTEIDQWLPRLHSLVIGPGLGREQNMLDVVKQVLHKAMERDMPLVIDADGLYLITQEPEIIQGYKKAILTPNVMEFTRLHQKVLESEPNPSKPVDCVISLSKKLGGVTIACKGKEDIITDGNKVLICNNEGSARRCGGQGDLLSGSMGVFTHWAHLASNKTHSKELQTYGPTISAAYAACLLTRECNKQAFSKHGRSMMTSDMINVIHTAYEKLYS